MVQRVEILLLGAASSLITQCLGIVPAFDVNLDEPPEQRWLGVTNYYKNEIIGTVNKLVPMMNRRFGNNAWIKNIQFDKEYEAELQGMVKALGHGAVTLDRLKYLNMMYELESPMGCSGVLWAMPNGTVVQGRNLDDTYGWSFQNWPDVTFDVTLHKGGRPLLRYTLWPGFIGMHTGMRYQDGPRTGWAFQQNTRRPNIPEENLAAAPQGGLSSFLAVRRIMETTPDYATALDKLYKTKFMAPQYFVISGSNPFEGAVLTIDRLGVHAVGTPPIQKLSNGPAGSWYLVQTNDDLNDIADDDRRPIATYLMERAARDITMSEDNMFQFLHTTKLLNAETEFSTVMVPAVGYYKTILPDEPPVVIDGESVSAEMMMTNGLALPQAKAVSLRTSTRVRRRSRFLGPRQHRTLASATHPVSDEVSFMQLWLDAPTWRLEPTSDL